MLLLFVVLVIVVVVVVVIIEFLWLNIEFSIIFTILPQRKQLKSEEERKRKKKQTHIYNDTLSISIYLLKAPKKKGGLQLNPEYSSPLNKVHSFR